MVEECAVLGVSHLLTIDDTEIKQYALEAAFYQSRIHDIGKFTYTNEMTLNLTLIKGNNLIVLQVLYNLCRFSVEK